MQCRAADRTGRRKGLTNHGIVVRGARFSPMFPQAPIRYSALMCGRYILAQQAKFERAEMRGRMRAEAAGKASRAAGAISSIAFLPLPSAAPRRPTRAARCALA